MFFISNIESGTFIRLVIFGCWPGNDVMVTIIKKGVKIWSCMILLEMKFNADENSYKKRNLEMYCSEVKLA